MASFALRLIKKKKSIAIPNIMNIYLNGTNNMITDGINFPKSPPISIRVLYGA